MCVNAKTCTHIVIFFSALCHNNIFAFIYLTSYNIFWHFYFFFLFLHQQWCRNAINFSLQVATLPQLLFLQLSHQLRPFGGSCNFFSDLHHEISGSWKQPFSTHLTNAVASDVTKLAGSLEQGYTSIPAVEDTLATHLSPSSAPSWKSLLVRQDGASLRKWTRTWA